MNDSQQLREQMWDLIYGLLSPEESQPLVARIKSDPQAARLYAEVRLQADLVGYAAKIEDPSLHFQIDSAAGKTQQVAPAHRLPAPRAGGRRIPARSVLMGLAATALAALLAVGIFWPQPALQSLAANHFVTEVQGPATLREGISAKITVTTTYPVSFGQTSNEEQHAAMPADVEVQLVDAENAVRHRRLVRTSSEDGRAEVELPGEAIEPGVRLKVTAARQLSEADSQPAPDANNAPPQADRSSELADQPSANVLTAALQVVPEPVDSYVVLESPPQSPDSEISFYAFFYKPFSGKLVPVDPAQITLHNADGASIGEPMWSVDPANGIVRGSVQLPRDLAKDELTVRMRESSGAEAEVQLGQLLAEKKLLADNGASTYGLGVTADQKAEQLARRGGAGNAAGSGQPPAGGESRFFEQEEPGRGEKRSELAAKGQAGAGEGFAAEGAEPAGLTGSIVTVPIPAEAAAKANDLVAVAVCRGVRVASAALADGERWAKNADRTGSPPEQTILLELPPEADGEIEIALVDRRATPPQVIERRVIYREPTRKLNIALADGQQPLAAGQPARLTLQVTDENGEPAAGANLFVRVWNELAVQQSAEAVVTLDDLTRGRARGLSFREKETASGKQIAGMGYAPATAGSALSRDKATLEYATPIRPAQGRRQQDGQAGENAPEVVYEQFHRQSDTQSDFAEQKYFDAAWGYEALAPTPYVTLASSREQAQAAYAGAVRTAQDERRTIVRAIFLVVLGGAVLLIAIFAVLGLKRLPMGRRLVIPAVAIAAASLVIGLVWFGRPPGTPQVAVAPTSQPPGRAESVAPGEDAPAPMSPAPATADGRAASDLVSRFGNEPPQPQAEMAAGAATTGAPAPADDPASFPLAATPPPATTPALPSPAPAPTEPLPGVPEESIARKPQPTGDVAASGPSAASLSAPAGPRPPAPQAAPIAAADSRDSNLRKSGAAPPANQAERSELKLEKAGGEAKRPADSLDAVPESLAMKKEAADNADVAKGGAVLSRSAKGKASPAPGTPAPGTLAEAGQQSRAPAAGFGGGLGAGGFGGRLADSTSPAGGGVAGVANTFQLPPGGTAGGFGAPGSGPATLRGGQSLAPSPAGNAPRADGGQLADGELRSNRSSGAPAAPVLYANPQLVTDANGRATIEFTMPPGETAYRLLVDALGKGRIGSKQEVIVGTSEASSSRAP